MSSEGYSYTNDVDEGGVLNAAAPSFEQNNSPLVQTVTEPADSNADYEYIESSLSVGFDEEFEDGKMALALEDLVGVNHGSPPSEAFENNSVFEIVSVESGAKSPGETSQQTCSGTDFDTLPIAPIAKRPIEAPPSLTRPQPSSNTNTAATTHTVARRSNNASSSNYGKSAANGPNLPTPLTGANDVTKNFASPMRYQYAYGASSSPGPAHGVPPHQSLNSNAKHGKGGHEYAFSPKLGLSAADSSSGPHGNASRSALKLSAADTASRSGKSLSTTAVSIRTGLPAPSGPQPSAIQNKSDGEGFGFGIETFLHGTQLGFGRQPSFKLIAPGASSVANNASKPYYLIPGMIKDGNNFVVDTSIMNTPLGTTGRPTAGGADFNAEGFSTWLEALDPKVASSTPSARSPRAAASSLSNNSHAVPAAGPSVGEDFKREVDVLMKDLLGDYYFSGGMGGAVAPSTSFASGAPPAGLSTSAGGTSNARWSTLQIGGGKSAVRQLDYDSVCKDAHMPTPAPWSPKAAGVATATTTAVEERRKLLSNTPEAVVATADPHSACAVNGEMKALKMVWPTQLGAAATAVAPKSILSTTPTGSAGGEQAADGNGTTPTKAIPLSKVGQRSPQQSLQGPQAAPPSLPDVDGTLNRRRRVWSKSVPAPGGAEGISGTTLDLPLETETDAEPPDRAPQRDSGAPAATRPILPRPGTTSHAVRITSMGAGVAAAGEQSSHMKNAASRRQSNPRADLGHTDRALLSSIPETYEDIDRDLLAGGYMTTVHMTRGADLFSEANCSSEKEADVKVTRVLPISPKANRKSTPFSQGPLFSSVDGHIGAPVSQTSLLRQKRHPSWTRKRPSSTAATSDKSPESAKSDKKAITSSPTLTPQQDKPLSNDVLRLSTQALDETDVESMKPPLLLRTSIPSITANRASLSIDSGPQVTNPLPSFTVYEVPNARLLQGASANAASTTPRDPMHKGANVVTTESPSKLSQRANVAHCGGRDDADLSIGHSGAIQPRRRLKEFRISVNTSAEARAEAAKQRDREMEIQQANEERRQRIQAFMAKRKAEKQLEELRRSQLMERDRQLQAYREEQGRQRIIEATAPEPIAATTSLKRQRPKQQDQGAVTGSGLNPIKTSQRMCKSTLDRPQRQPVLTASFIPDASTVPMPLQQAHSEPAAGVAPRGKQNASPPTTSAAGPKTKVRAVVVFIDNNVAANAAKESDVAEEQRRLRNSSTAATAVHEGTSVAIQLNEAGHMLKVLQPQERARYFDVDEYVLINGTNPHASLRASDNSGAIGSRSAAGAPRRRLISLTLTETSRKFLAGVNVALLLASTKGAQDAPMLAIREVVEGVVSHMPAQSQLFVSIAYVAGGKTEDLLADPPRSVRSTFSTSLLYGPLLDDVEYVPVTGVGHLLRTVADAYKRVRECQQQPESGLLVTSLLLKQCRNSDVILSSYLISDAGCDGSIYTAILRKSQHTPFALFHSALGGPTLTTALMAVDSEAVTTVVPLLSVQHRLSSVMNKPCHVGSVRRFVELAQRELDAAGNRPNKGSLNVAAANSNKRSNEAGGVSCETSSDLLSNNIKNNSGSNQLKVVRQQLSASQSTIHKHLSEQVSMAKQILEDPAGYLPKGVLPTDGENETLTTVRSVASTVSPFAAAAPRVQLTKKQEEEAKSSNLSNIGLAKKVLHTAPVATVTASFAVGANRAKVATGAETGPVQTSRKSREVALPSVSPASAVPSVSETAVPTSTAAATAMPPLTSVARLKRPGMASTEPPPIRSAARLSCSGTASATAGRAPATASSRDAQHVLSSVLNSSNSIAHAPPAASPGLSSHDGSGGGGAVLPPLRHSASNERSISVSGDYVRRGHDSGDVAVQRNTGFMNLEDAGTSLSVPPTGKGAAQPTQQQRQQRPKNLSTPSDHSKLSQQLVTTTTRAGGSAEGEARGNLSATPRRVPASDERTSSELQPFAPPSLPGGALPAGVTGNKKLLPGATTIGSNGPQWPSTHVFEIPVVPSVASIDTSFTHEASISMRQSSNAYESEKTPIPTSTKVRTLVVVDAHCRETSNVTFDNTMVIATTEDDFEEYDVDEVLEATPGQRELIQAELLKELCDTLLMGCNAAILGADSRPTGFSAQVLKSVVHTVFAEMSREGTHRSGRLSASIVKVKGESVVDLLKDSGASQKLVIAISPLFGSCVHGVTYADVPSGVAFNDTIDAALKRAASHDNGRDYGFVFCSLLFKLRLEEEGDVQVCSLVTTFAGENVGLYTSVLDRSPLVPRALFHYALGGPSYTVALLGIGSEETRANQMLQVQKRLGEMSNRATHPGSVAKFVAGIRNDLTPSLIAKYESSRDPSERAATKEMIERLAEMVKDADALLVDFDHHQPKAYLHGDADNKPPQGLLSTPLSVPPATAVSAEASGGGNKSYRSGLSSDPLMPHQQGMPTPVRSSAAQRAMPSITAVDQDSQRERIQTLVCFEQVMMGAGTVAVQGNTILCASQGGTRFDSNEVITRDENHRSLSSRLMDELVAKFLSGKHTGLLAADSSYSAFTPLMLRHIANNVLEAVLGGNSGGQEEDNCFAFKPPTINGELQVSIALIKDDVTADLLPIDVDATYHRFEMEHTPLYGSRIVGVTPHLVANPQDFDRFLAVAIDNADPALQTADPGIMVVSLVLTQRVKEPVEDVLVSSLLCTAVFDSVHHYERVLEGNPSEPLDLFKNMLRGQCFSVALLGISDEEEDPGKLLRALNDLSQVRNRVPQVNSVSRHIRELHSGIVKLKERMTTSSNSDEKAYIQRRVEVAEKLLEEAESLQRNPLSSMQPCTFVPLGSAAGLHS
ncbi:hypothetical protein ABL78_7554 [Leptomonas seymouri]|uniref:Uncharacterized protein n=1 Tax=Leptomonas seymouri TaxID=5684 RepID=A0A0N1IH13_LEPSE|nr:hypothetical protein ABL78_7554 [Leptomonas seymouri]|eukprot:KPI83411.1 hypothetical protein ABL78_7554 [Leptomonas seymouri]